MMKSWYVINTKPFKEFIVEKLLKDVGIEVYNPKIINNGRIRAFFPCYVFSKFSVPENYRLIKYTRGVRKILENEFGPIPLEERIIQEIKSREENGFIIIKKRKEPPKLGEKVEIIEGPFKGFQGIFEREISGSERVAILLQVVNYQARLFIEKNKLIKA